MSAREWRPGDVALRIDGNDRSLAMYARRCNFHATGGAHWHTVHANGLGDWDTEHEGVQWVPLVVIDPESEDDRDRLCKALVEAMYEAGDRSSASQGVHPATMAVALREFAAPTPPKPDEPLGLGAVVRDDNGRVYVRAANDDIPWVDIKADAFWSKWADLAVSSPDQILSAGWSEDGAR